MEGETVEGETVDGRRLRPHVHVRRRLLEWQLVLVLVLMLLSEVGRHIMECDVGVYTSLWRWIVT